VLQRRVPVAAMVVLAVAYAALAGLARPFTLPADVAAAVAGVAVLAAAALAGPAPGEAWPWPPGLRWWVVLTVVLVGLELAELFGGPRPSHPTLSSLSGPLLGHWAGRAAVYLAWLWLGRMLARR
jgi:hypothetical protein